MPLNEFVAPREFPFRLPPTALGLLAFGSTFWPACSGDQFTADDDSDPVAIIEGVAPATSTSSSVPDERPPRTDQPTPSPTDTTGPTEVPSPPDAGSGEADAGDDPTLVHPLPGIVEAADYARSYDTDVRNRGAEEAPECDRGDEVDLQTSLDQDAGECSVGWTVAGEWLEYDVLVESAGTFEIELRASSLHKTDEIRIEIDSELAGDLVMPGEGFDKFVARSLVNVPIAAGLHTVRVLFVTGDTNLSLLQFLPY